MCVCVRVCAHTCTSFDNQHCTIFRSLAKWEKVFNISVLNMAKLSQWTQIEGSVYMIGYTLPNVEYTILTHGYKEAKALVVYSSHLCTTLTVLLTMLHKQW